MIQINGQNFLERKDVMQLFGISGVTLCKWGNKGIIRPHKFGKSVLYLEEEIYEDIKRCGSAIRKSHKAKMGAAV